MKASVFIKTALIDQMQQIADLGLWFHLAKLIPSGVEVLARVWYLNDDDGMVFLPDRIEDFVKRFYKEVIPGEYSIFPQDSAFFSRYPRIYLTSAPEYAEKHRQSFGVVKTHIHVPQWFDDFKSACQIVLDEIAAGNLEDIEVLKMLEENGGDK